MAIINAPLGPFTVSFNTEIPDDDEVFDLAGEEIEIELSWPLLCSAAAGQEFQPGEELKHCTLHAGLMERIVEVMGYTHGRVIDNRRVHYLFPYGSDKTTLAEVATEVLTEEIQLMLKSWRIAIGTHALKLMEEAGSSTVKFPLAMDIRFGLDPAVIESLWQHGLMSDPSIVFVAVRHEVPPDAPEGTIRLGIGYEAPSRVAPPGGPDVPSEDETSSPPPAAA